MDVITRLSRHQLQSNRDQFSDACDVQSTKSRTRVQKVSSCHNLARLSQSINNTADRRISFVHICSLPKALAAVMWTSEVNTDRENKVTRDR